MSVNGKKFDFSKFAHLDTDPDLERDGVETPVGDSGIVVKVSRAGGRNYGFQQHRDAVAERWKKTHGRGALKGEDMRNFNRDVFAYCIRDFNADVVGYPYDADAARALIELEEVFEVVLDRAASMEGYRRQRVDDAKDAAGNA